MKRVVRLELADGGDEDIYFFYTEKTEKEIRSEVIAILKKWKIDKDYNWSDADHDISNIDEQYNITGIYMTIWDWYK